MSTQYPCHIVHAEIRKGVAKASGNPYEMVTIQGVLEVGEDRQIFRSVLPTGSDLPKPGRYIIDFEPQVDTRNMELGGRITKLTAAPAGKP